MAVHNQLGRHGEELAERFLVEKGYFILHRNWRFSHYEIDLIAQKNGLLHFVEVKLRSSAKFGQPEEQVNKKKFSDLCKAADAYLFRNPQHKHIQFDILSITLPKGAEPAYFFIEDVYL